MCDGPRQAWAQAKGKGKAEGRLGVKKRERGRETVATVKVPEASLLHGTLLKLPTSQALLQSLVL